MLLISLKVDFFITQSISVLPCEAFAYWQHKNNNTKSDCVMKKSTFNLILPIR